MKENMKDLTEAQLTMSLILEERGVKISEVDSADLHINPNCIVVRGRGVTDYVYLFEDDNTIVVGKTIISSQDLGMSSYNRGVLHWRDTETEITETWSVVDGFMQYKKATVETDCIENEDGGNRLSDYDRKEEFATYQLPTGYKRTDGISAFTGEQAVKVNGK